MGGSKKAAKAPIKKDSKYKIPAYFNCPLCDAKQSVIVKLFRTKEEGTVQCRVCREPKDTKKYSFVPGLEKKVDVFFKYFEEVRLQDQMNLALSGVQTNQARKVEGLAQFDGLFDRDDEERIEAAHIFDAPAHDDYEDDEVDRLFTTD